MPATASIVASSATSWKSAAKRSSPESVIAHDGDELGPGVKTSSRGSFARST